MESYIPESFARVKSYNVHGGIFHLNTYECRHHWHHSRGASGALGSKGSKYRIVTIFQVAQLPLKQSTLNSTHIHTHMRTDNLNHSNDRTDVEIQTSKKRYITETTSANTRRLTA